MELISPGIGLIFWMIIIFGILLFILKKFAWKPIISALEHREFSIKEALESAEKARDEIKNLQKKTDELLRKTKLEREKLIIDAHQKKEAILESAKIETLTLRKQIMEQAKKEILHEKALAMAELKTQVVALSTEISEKILTDILSDKEKQQQLAEKYLTDLNIDKP